MTCELSYIWKNRTEWNFRLSEAKECEAKRREWGGGWGEEAEDVLSIKYCKHCRCGGASETKGPDVKGGLRKNCWTAWRSFLADKLRGPSI